MRIACVVSSAGGGGAERAAANLCRFLAQKDDELRVLALWARKGYDFGTPVIDTGMPYGHQSRKLRGFIFRPLRLARRLLFLRQQINDFKPKVILSFGDAANYNLLAARPLVRDSRIIINQQVAPLYAYGGLSRQVYLYVTRLLYPRADTVVALSEGVRQELTRVVPSLRDAAVIPNAIDFEEIRRLSMEPLHDRRPSHPVLISVGRLERQKDHATLLRAVSRMPDMAQPNVWIVGEGTLRPALESLAGELGLSSRVRFLGWQENVFSLMRAADVFVLSSLYEGFANVVVEALACGTPVISTDCPFGPNEILDKGKYGLLVEPGDPIALSQAIGGLLADGARRKELSIRGISRAEQYDLAIVGDTYRALIASILST